MWMHEEIRYGETRVGSEDGDSGRGPIKACACEKELEARATPSAARGQETRRRRGRKSKQGGREGGRFGSLATERPSNSRWTRVVDYT